MQLRILLFAGLRERAGRAELALSELPEALSLGELKALLQESHPELGDLGHVSGVVGDRYVQDDFELSGIDEVALLPPVSGGEVGDADLERGVFLLEEASLDVEALRRLVEDARCGAVVLFSGNVREVNRDQPVVRIDYEAFERLAGPEMERIFVRCRAEVGEEVLLRMVCAHRVGPVEVGEASVVIAVASPHRDEAFRAARFLIDTLKESLPVWKKEIYEGGHHWIGDRS